MHSSRMCTVCSSSHLCGGGLPQCMLGYQPPWTRPPGTPPPWDQAPPRADPLGPGTPPEQAPLWTDRHL